MPVEIIEIRPITPPRATLRGFVTVHNPATGLIVHDVALHARGDSRWASPPGRPMLGRDGLQMRGKDGKLLFSPVISFANRAATDLFSRAALAAVEAAHPGVLS